MAPTIEERLAFLESTLVGDQQNVTVVASDVANIQANDDGTGSAIFLSASDGAHGAMPRQGSQSGVAVAAAHPCIEHGPGPAALLLWISTRAKRIMRSSMAVETDAAGLRAR